MQAATVQFTMCLLSVPGNNYQRIVPLKTICESGICLINGEVSKNTLHKNNGYA